MILTLIVGETGSGKSTIAKKAVNDSINCIVYDVQNEYNLPVFCKGFRGRKFRLTPENFDIKDFVLFTKSCRNFLFVIEEATGIFRGSIGTDFVQSILSKRHTNNSYILIFHSLHRVPIQLYEFCDVLYLFKTNDLQRNIESKYPKLLDGYLSLQSSPRYSKLVYKLSNLVK